MTTKPYTTQLQAGLGLVEQTRILLELWQPGMRAAELQKTVLQSGRFPNIAARRVRNLVVECFAPRYLVEDSMPARLLKTLGSTLSNQEFEQLLFLYTCRANTILLDFVREVYWHAYSAGRDVLTNDEARAWIMRANQDGKTMSPWSDSTIQKVTRYLTGTCADYGLLERGHKGVRRIQPYRIGPHVAAVLAYDLHFKGHGDNNLLNHPDWELFGLDREDVLQTMKNLALKSLLIVQSAGGVTRVSWSYKTMGELIDVLAHG